MDAGGSCNYMSASDSMVRFYSSELEVYYWTYVSVPKGMTYAEYAHQGPNIHSMAVNSDASSASSDASSASSTNSPFDESTSDNSTPAANLLANLKNEARRLLNKKLNQSLG